MDRISILGVPLDILTRKQAVERIVAMLHSEAQHCIATPNPEMLVAASRDVNFQQLLQSTDLNLPDGAGLLWAARYLGKPLCERVTGTDTMRDLCRLPDVPSIFLLGAAPGVAEEAKAILEKEHPSIRIVGTFAGSPSASEEADILAQINDAKPALLFVAYGAPAQEKWIARNLQKMPSVKVAMGVGGAFDFIAGRRVRAPIVFQKCGIEWIWRLIQEPRRIGRIVNAVIVFPLLVLMNGKPADPVH